MHPTHQPAEPTTGPATHPSTADAVPPTSPGLILHQAADYLGTHGWIQGSHFDLADQTSTHPSACAIGAIIVVSLGFADRTALFETDTAGKQPMCLAIEALGHYLAGTPLPTTDPHPVPGMQVIEHADLVANWNDLTFTTTADAQRALRNAARPFLAGGAA